MQLEKTMLFPLIMLMMMLIVYDSDHFGDGVIDGDLVGEWSSPVVVALGYCTSCVVWGFTINGRLLSKSFCKKKLGLEVESCIVNY